MLSALTVDVNKIGSPAPTIMGKPYLVKKKKKKKKHALSMCLPHLTCIFGSPTSTSCLPFAYASFFLSFFLFFCFSLFLSLSVVLLLSPLFLGSLVLFDPHAVLVSPVETPLLSSSVLTSYDGRRLLAYRIREREIERAREGHRCEIQEERWPPPFRLALPSWIAT